MRFDEPELLVQFARDTGEQIAGIRVAGSRCTVDAGPRGFTEGGKLVGDGGDVLHAFDDIERVLGKARSRGDSRRSVSAAAERSDALRKFVALILHNFRDLVEQLVKGDEAGSFDVSVRLFHLREQVDRIGKACLQQRYAAGADGFGEVDSGLVHVVSLWKPDGRSERFVRGCG